MSSAKYIKIEGLSHSKFKRCTGISKFLFEIMVLVVNKWKNDTHLKEGRKPKLCVEDQILMLLEYYREYRTFFHLGVDYGLNESNVQRTIEKLENILFESGYFKLQGKRVLLDNNSIKSIRIDVTECNIQRPKKS